MVLLVLLSGMLLIALPRLARPMGRRLAPREWSVLCAVALAGGAVLIELGLILLAAPTVLLALDAPALASLCERLVGPLLPGGPVLGMVAVPPAVTMPALAALGIRREHRRSGRCALEPWVGNHLEWEGLDVVLLPTDDVVAFSVKHGQAQILVSVGMVATLSEAQLVAVLRHERAHLMQGHHRLLNLAIAIEHGLPPARPSTTALRVSLERWADEASVAGDEPARIALRDALLQTTAGCTGPRLAAFSPVETVAERLDALQSPPLPPSRIRRGLLYSPGLVVAIVALGATAAWLGDAQVLVTMTSHCPL